MTPNTYILDCLIIMSLLHVEHSVNQEITTKITEYPARAPKNNSSLVEFLVIKFLPFYFLSICFSQTIMELK